MRGLPKNPRALRCPDAVSERRAMLTQPHIAPLQVFLDQLRAEGRGIVPDFDPLDGGVNAEILFLFEKPGPMTDASKSAGRIGSGFISRDNDDPTAEATFLFMKKAGIDRRRSLLANTIPWWNGVRKIRKEEREAGLNRLGDLCDRLPLLRSVVMVGQVARRATPVCIARDLQPFYSLHPSPINRGRRFFEWSRIPELWRQAGDGLGAPLYRE